MELKHNKIEEFSLLIELYASRINQENDADINLIQSEYYMKTNININYVGLVDDVIREISYFLCENDRFAKMKLSEIDKLLYCVQTIYILHKALKLPTEGGTLIDDTEDFIKDDSKEIFLRYTLWICKVIDYFTLKLKSMCEDCDRLDLYESIFCEVIEEPEQKELPKELSTPEAKKLLDKAVCAGYLNDDYSRNDITKSQAAYMAEIIAEKLFIKNKWAVFGKLWEDMNFSRLRNDSKNMGKVTGSKEIDKLFM